MAITSLDAYHKKCDHLENKILSKRIIQKKTSVNVKMLKIYDLRSNST